MGAVRCEKHGTHTAGPLCCDHIRKAVAYSMAFIPFGIYRLGFPALQISSLRSREWKLFDKAGYRADHLRAPAICADPEHLHRGENRTAFLSSILRVIVLPDVATSHADDSRNPAQAVQ